VAGWGEQSLTQGARRKAQEDEMGDSPQFKAFSAGGSPGEVAVAHPPAANTSQEIGLRFVYPMAQHLG
jgi:hypothetical protein